MYSVMLSDGNSFCGDVVFDSFIKASREEAYTNTTEVLKSNFMSFLLICAVFLQIFSTTSEI